MDAGVDGVLASAHRDGRGALAELSRAVPLYAVLPVLSEHDRHELEPGIEAVLARAPPARDFGARKRASASASSCAGPRSSTATSRRRLPP